MKSRTAIGLGVSLLWVAGVSLLVWFKWSTVDKLSLNEWGDFLAGSVAPLALFWLVLGYFQQGEELQQNTDALLGQQRAQESQARETNALVQTTARQAAASEALAAAAKQDRDRALATELRAMQPLLAARGGVGSNNNCEIEVLNEGAAVKRLSIVTPPGPVMAIRPTDLLPAGSIARINLSGKFEYPFQFVLHYVDLANRERTQCYELVAPFSLVEVLET